MPTYEYRCTECGAELEVTQKFSDPALTVCPTCAGPLRKVFNAVGVVFKGSGFYRTDSRTGNGRGDGAAAGGKDGKAAESSPNAEPAPKSPSKTSTNGGSSKGSSSGSKERAEKVGAGAR